MVELKEIRHHYWVLLNQYGEAMTDQVYFTNATDAKDWAKKWASSWYDVYVVGPYTPE